MASVVVCDDDKVLRAAVSTLCEHAGLEVVAETDRGHDALELVRRFGVEVLVLDLVLADGSGEHALEELAGQDGGPAVVVFTAYAGDAGRLVRLGAREVIEKPDLDSLGRALERLASPGVHIDLREPAGDERRQIRRDVEQVPDLWRSPSGISSAYDLKRSLLHTVEGDSVLIVALQDLDALASTVGPTLAADCHLALGRLLREALRVQDVVHEAPDPGGFIGVLRGGDVRAADAAWRRLVHLFEVADLPGRLAGACSRVDGIGGLDAVARALAALRSVEPGASLLLSA